MTDLNDLNVLNDLKEKLSLKKELISFKEKEISSKEEELTFLKQELNTLENQKLLLSLKIQSELIDQIKKQKGYTNKMVKIPVLVTGNDHDDGYCSGNDGYELEEELSYLIMSTDYLIEINSENYNYDNLNDLSFDDEGEYKGKNNFFLNSKGCSSRGSGYCYCSTNYEGKGSIIWLKNEKLVNDIIYPTLKHIYKE